LFTRLTELLPQEGIKIILVLFLSFLIGLDREERSATGGPREQSTFGGVRTFPLVGLIGYALAFLSGPQLAPLTVGFAVVGAFLWLSYKHKLEKYEFAGATTEVSALTTYVIGALVSRGEFWIGTTIAVISVLLLELKGMLEGLSRRLPAAEILAFTKFLLLTAVILPILPNRTFGASGFNPFKAWLIVVAASGISYGSYLLQKLAKGHDSVFLSAVLGGAYSSTVTTVVLAKRARTDGASHVYAGGILMAAGVMYLRTIILIGLFSRELMMRLLLPFAVLGFGALLAGWLWSRGSDAPATPDAPSSGAGHDLEVKNPLQLSTAFLFGLVFVLMLAATDYASAYLGHGGIYGLAAVTGLTDITPFILGLTQTARANMPIDLAAGGIIVAAASNNLIKGFYAFSIAGGKTGRQALFLLAAFAALGLLPLAF
jgi:uncharacterized membrane protein (DUF4010 family)